jgi:hypothetical protein
MSSSKRNDLIAAAEIVGGIIFTGIAIALSDAGFHIWGFILGFLAVVCGLTVAAHHLKKYGLKYVNFLLFISLILAAGLFGFLAVHKPPVESKPHPYFIFSLMLTDNPSECLKLTNDFLIDTNFGTPRTCAGGLIIPLEPGQTNVLLRLEIENNSSVASEYGEVSIMIPEKWGPVVGSEWHPVVVRNLSSVDFNESGRPVGTNVMLAWGWNMPTLLGGDGTRIPDIQLRQAPMFAPVMPVAPMRIQARAKDSPTDAISFWLFTIPNSFRGIKLFHKPFILLGTNVNGYLEIGIGPEKVEESK